MKHINIAIDGPSGAGKSTIARTVAKNLGLVYVDTGAMYRSIGLFVLRTGIGSRDAEAIGAVLGDIHLEMKYVDGLQRMFLNGEDVTDKIRTPEVTAYASDVSAIPAVRSFLLDTQRELARTESVIMDGRDIGTVVLPDAELKIFLTASAEERARRRWLEFRQKGVDIEYEKVLQDIIERDRNDSTRDIAPLKPAEDSVLVDTSALDLAESVAAIEKLVREKL